MPTNAPPPVTPGHELLVADEKIRKLLTDPELLAQLSDVVSVVDRDLRYLYLSRSAPMAPSSLIGTCLLELVAEQDLERVREVCGSALAERRPRTLVASDIVGRTWESRLVPTHDGDRPLLFMSSSDVTERTQKERQLSERESRLRSAIESSGVGTWTWDPRSDELTWDAGLFRILDRDQTEPPNGYRTYLEYVHPDDQAWVESQIAKCIHTGVFDEFEHRLVRPDGNLRFVVSRGAVIRDDQGVVTGMRGGIFDVTDRKRLEEQLRHVQKMEAVGQLTAGIAHNFNNLISIILPNVERCRARAPAELHAPLDDVLHAAERAVDLVRQLMRFSRMDVGSPRESTDLGALVHHLARICRATFDRRIAIDVAVAPDLPPILARAGEIEQVVLNICINARDALVEAHTPHPRLALTVERAGAELVRIAIADNGPGMDASIRARMFEPFFTTKDVSKGTGLGLASAYAIVIDHQGTLRCESALGEGSTFVIELPVATAPPGPVRCDVAPPASRGHEVVLVVDDEALVRRALRAVLEEAGFRVLEAGDGGEGLTLLQRHADQVDVVVLDRSMPRMSGEQFLLELGHARGRVKVVLLTGHAGEEPALDDVDAVMIKPPRTGELLRTIRQVLDARAP